MKGKGKVGHVCPGREPQTSPGGRLTTKPSNQEADAEPLDTAETCAFFLIWEAGRSYKAFPHPSHLADSLCLLAHPPPGVLPESDRPIKGPDQQSTGVALSSCGISYIWRPMWGSR